MKKVILVMLLLTMLVLVSGCDSLNSNNTEQNIPAQIPNVTQPINVVHNNTIVTQVENKTNTTSKYGNNTNLAIIEAKKHSLHSGSSSMSGSGESSSSSDDSVSDESSGVSADVTSADDQNASDEIDINSDSSTQT